MDDTDQKSYQNFVGGKLEFLSYPLKRYFAYFDKKKNKQTVQTSKQTKQNKTQNERKTNKQTKAKTYNP